MHPLLVPSAVLRGGSSSSTATHRDHNGDLASSRLRCAVRRAVVLVLTLGAGAPAGAQPAERTQTMAAAQPAQPARPRPTPPGVTPLRMTMHFRGGLAEADFDEVDRALEAAGYHGLTSEWVELGGAWDFSIHRVRWGLGASGLVVDQARRGENRARASAIAFDMMFGVDVYSRPRIAIFPLTGFWVGGFGVTSPVAAPALFPARISPFAPIVGEDETVRVWTGLFAPRFGIGFEQILVPPPKETALRSAAGGLLRIEAGYRVYFGGKWTAQEPFREYLDDLGRAPHLRTAGPYVTLGLGFGAGTERGHPPACPVIPNTMSEWDGDRCELTCVPHFADCNQLPADGCETPLDTTRDCGACGAVCRVNHGTGVCVRRAEPAECTLGHCDPGRGNCDGHLTNGCEVDLMADRRHCGACGRACRAGDVCSLGECRMY